MFESILAEQNSSHLRSYLLLKICQALKEGKATKTQSRTQCAFQYRVEHIEYQKPGHISLQSPGDTSAAMAQIQKGPFCVANFSWWTLQPPVQPADLLEQLHKSGLCSLFPCLSHIALYLPPFAFLQITCVQINLCHVKGLGISLVAWRAGLCSVAHPGAVFLNKLLLRTIFIPTSQ